MTKTKTTTKSKSKAKTKKVTNVDAIFDRAVDILNSKHGMDVIERVSTVADRPIVGHSTGSIALDWLISPVIGGMEAGRVIELWGDFSTGKTTLALGLCANVLKHGRKGVFIDAENSFRPDLARNLGIDLSNLHLMDKLTARDSANAAMQLVKTGRVGIVIVDSVAAWKPIPQGKKGEKDVDMTKDKIGAHSLFLSQTLPHLSHLCRQHGTILVLLNQARTNVSGYGAALVPFGGKAEEHQNNVRLRLTGTARSVQPRILNGETKEIIGQWVTVFCDKNKIDMPFKEVRIPLIFGAGVNPFMELAELAILTEQIEARPGGRYWLKDGKSEFAHGMDNLYAALYEDLSVFHSLRSQVIEALGIKYQDGHFPVNAFLREDGAKREIGEMEIGEPELDEPTLGEN
jgi:recombination protein RecA